MKLWVFIVVGWLCCVGTAASMFEEKLRFPEQKQSSLDDDVVVSVRGVPDGMFDDESDDSASYASAVQDCSELLPREQELCDAVEKCDVPKVREMIAAGVSPFGVDANGCSLLMLAATREDVEKSCEMIALLLNKGAFIHHQDNQGGTVFDYVDKGSPQLHLLNFYRQKNTRLFCVSGGKKK